MAGQLILIVDDDQTQHLILGEYLKLSGYEVDHAEEGAQGLKLMEQRKPDLVLLDIQMPVMDGFKTLEVIRKKSEFKHIPIMLLTSLDRQHLKIKGLELGADDYITKPFNRAELLARINATLRRAERNRPMEGMLSGDLSDVGLSDLLQSMELGNKTASIDLEDVDGEIYIDNGMLVHVRQGNFTGEQALTRIFLKERGAFTVKFNDLPADLTGDPIPLMSVLMAVLAKVDDVKEIIKRMRAENRVIKIADDIASFPAIAKFKDKSPISFVDLMILMEDDINKNLKTLISASKKGKLKIIK